MIKGVFKENIAMDNDLFLKENESFNIISNNLIVSQYGENKFKDDNISFEDDELIVVSDGVILNSKQLINKFRVRNIFYLIKKMYFEKGEKFASELRGPFNIILYDKHKNKLYLYTNQFADKQIFYFYDNDILIFASDIYEVKELGRRFKAEFSLDIESAYNLITYSYMMEDKTLLKQVKKVKAGCFLCASKQSINLMRYHRFNNEILYTSNSEKILNQMDELFREAVKLEYEKDNEYGYWHITSLSGGLDSRMTTWVANDLGYKNIVNMTFSKSGYLDQTIAQEISTYLGTRFIFKSLDDCEYIKYVDRVTKMNSGMSCYSGAAHGLSMMELVDFKRMGLIHTGMLGDVIVGTFSSYPYHGNAQKGQGAYSETLKDRLNTIENEYENEELFKLYGRGFNCALNSSSVSQHYGEVVSPFIDIDFMQFCLNVDVALRYKHKLYYKWILSKYPEAGSFIYEKKGIKVSSPLLKHDFFRKLFVEAPRKVEKANARVKYKLGISNTNAYSKNMNPFEFWYQTNFEMSNFINNYFKENIYILDGYKQLQDDVDRMFSNSNAREKMQILTLLSACKQLFKEK